MRGLSVRRPSLASLPQQACQAWNNAPTNCTHGRKATSRASNLGNTVRGAEPQPVGEHAIYGNNTRGPTCNLPGRPNSTAGRMATGPQCCLSRQFFLARANHIIPVAISRTRPTGRFSKGRFYYTGCCCFKKSSTKK
jgi:hypothetical protein